MKPRDLLLIILAVGITGGLVWWMWQPSAADFAKAGAVPNVDGSNASGKSTGMVDNTRPAVGNATADNDSTKSANDTADASSTDSTMLTDETKPVGDGTIVSAATNPGNDPAANGQDPTKAATANGLHFIAGPDGGADLVLAFLKETVAKNPNLVRQYGDINALQVMPPLPSYSLGIVALRNGESLGDGAVQNGLFPVFYYPVESSGNSVTGVMVTVSTAEGTLHAMPGGSTAAINAALNQLANNDQVSAGSYEARLLNIPNAPIIIWLKSGAGADTDLIFAQPMNAKATGMLYNATDYLKTLQPPAN